MALDVNTGEFITLDEAEEYVAAYRRRYPKELKGYFGGRQKLLDILEQPDCIGLRIYNGYYEQERRTNLVILGVNGKGKDMTEGLIMEKLGFCPPNCDITSPLY